MNKEDILKRLQAGEDPTVIGNELVAMLNQAMEEKKQADEAKRKEEEAKTWQTKDAEVLTEVLNDYLKKYCGGTGEDVTVEGIIAASADLGKMLKVVDKVSNKLNEVKTTALPTKEPKKRELPVKLTIKEKNNNEPVKTTVKTGKEAEQWIEDAFKQFFDIFGL